MANSLRIGLAAALLALPLWIAELTPAHACTCVEETLEERVNRADLILVASATAVEPTDVIPMPGPLSPPPSETVSTGVAVSVTVEEYVKGSGPETLVVSSSALVVYGTDNQIELDPATSVCSWFPAAGERALLLLTREEDGSLSDGVCSGSMPITAENEAEVLALIAQIQQILQGPAPTATVANLPQLGSGGGGSGGTPWPALGAAGAGALLAATALLALRRRSA